jgi:tetratricopeptide (TPR) repeat protein
MKNLTILLLVCNGLSLNAIGQHEAQENNCKNAKECLANYQFNKALKYLLPCNNDHMEHTKDIAMCYYKLGQLQKAESYYEKVLSRTEKDITAINQLAKIYAQKADYKQCMLQYEKLIAIDSSNSYYHKQMAIYAKKDNQLKKTFAHLGIAHHLNPDDISVIHKLTTFYLGLDQLDMAEKYMAKGLTLDSTHAPLLGVQAKLAYAKKDYSAVVHTINQCLRHQNDTTAYQLKLLGIAYFHLKENARSIECLKKAMAIQETEVIHYYLGLNYKETGILGKSTLHFEKAISIGITDHIATYYSALATVLEENGDYQASIKAYQTAYNYSQNKVILFHLARNYDTYYADKQPALAYYEKYLSHNDTGNLELMNYSQYRISEIRDHLHFALDLQN